MITKLLLPFLLLFFLLDGVGQITFNKLVKASQTIELSDIKQTNDDGFIIMGNSYFQNTSCPILIKTNAIGDTTWMQNYEVAGFYSDGNDLEVFNDGYLIAGTRVTGINSSTGYDCFLIRTDTAGEIIWTKIYYNSELSANGISITNTNDSGFIIKGFVWDSTHTYSKSKVIKLDSQGNREWDKTYDIKGNNSNVIQIDNNYFISTDNSLIKTNSIGEIEWIKEYDLPYSCSNCGWYKFYFSSISKVSDGFLIAGGYYLTEESSNSLIFKTDFDGNLIWGKSYSVDDFDGVTSINPANDGFILSVFDNAGGNWSSNSYVKIDFDGECQFFGGIVTSHYANKTDIIQTSDNGYAYVNTKTDFDAPPAVKCNFIKVDSNGVSNCKSVFNLNSDTVTVIGFIGNPIIIVSNTYSDSTVNIENFHSGGNIETYCFDLAVVELPNVSFEIFPNPFTSEAKIVFNVPQTNTKIQLLDVLGKELQSVSFSGTEFTIYRESLSASMYFLQITDASGKVLTKKIVLE
jgi:predicted nucleic-acid-binding Zn-ribbon protein